MVGYLNRERKEIIILQIRNKMKIYFRVFDLTIFSSLLNFTSVYERINKCSDTIHAYGKSKKIQKYSICAQA